MFLETITMFENDALIPINRIKHINSGIYESGYEIRITSDDGNWVECFGKDRIKFQKRYKAIKKILKSEVQK